MYELNHECAKQNGIWHMAYNYSAKANHIPTEAN